MQLPTKPYSEPYVAPPAAPERRLTISHRTFAAVSALPSKTVFSFLDPSVLQVLIPTKTQFSTAKVLNFEKTVQRDPVRARARARVHVRQHGNECNRPKSISRRATCTIAAEVLSRHAHAHAHAHALHACAKCMYAGMYACMRIDGWMDMHRQ